MARRTHWKELTGGIIAVAVIGMLIFATLKFARVGALHGKKVTLYVVTDEATGVRSGTEVWVAGQKRGLVNDVAFRPPSADASARLVITAEILEDALPNVRKDSYAQVRPSGDLIGTPVVYIATGMATSPPLRDRDTVYTRHKSRVGRLVTDVGTVAPEVSQLAANVKELNAKAKSPVGTLGSARLYGFPRMAEVSHRLSRLAGKAGGGGSSGTPGDASRAKLMARASHTMAAVDSIRTLMSSNQGSLGRFRRDSTLTTKARGLLAELDTLRAFASNPVAGIAAAHPDSALTRELDRTHALLAALIQDIRKNKMRYVNF